MEQINLTELLDKSRLDDESKESWLKWALIHLISQDGAGSSDRFFPERNPDKKTPAICHVELKINGIEVSFSKLYERLVESFNKNVDDTARNFVKKKVTDMIDGLASSVSEFQGRIEQMGEEFESHVIREGVRLDASQEDADYAIWAALLSMTQDVHSAQDTMTENRKRNEG